MLRLLSHLSNVENRCYNEDLVLVFTNRFWLSDLVKNVRWGVQTAHFDTHLVVICTSTMWTKNQYSCVSWQNQIHSTTFQQIQRCKLTLVSVSLSVSTITQSKKKKYKKSTDFIYKYVQAQQINDNNTLHLGSLSIRLLWSQQHNGKPLT